jgi:hypothetical protein
VDFLEACVAAVKAGNFFDLGQAACRKYFVASAAGRREFEQLLNHASENNGLAIAEQKKSARIAASRVTTGSPTWARTRDLRINSPSLYRLSYRGIAVKREGGRLYSKT